MWDLQVIHITGNPKGKEKGIKNAFEETLAENLLNLKAQRVPNKMNSNELQMKTNCNQNSKS